MTREPSVLLPLLTALLTLLIVSPLAFAASPPTITRISGCTDVGNFTSRCPPSGFITIWGSGFSINSSQALNVSIAGLWTFRIPFTSVDATGQSFPVYFFTPPADVPKGVWLNVTVSIPALSVSSDPFPGLSLLDYPLPVLTSISGCDGSGNATYNCLPDSSVLVFTGLNLFNLSAPAGVSVAPVGSQRGGGGVNFFYNSPSTNNTVNDTTVVLQLASVYQFIIQDVHFNGTLWIWLRFRGEVVTNRLTISIIPLPPPRVSSVGSRGCNNTIMLEAPQAVDCVGGYSELILYGDYFYAPFTITVGGVECYITGQGTTFFQPKYASCQLQPLPGGQYDVNVTNAAGSLILPQAVGMSFSPAVAAVLSAQCAVDAGSTQTSPRLKCSGGEAITVTGLNFRTDVDSFRVVITDPYNTTQQLDCLTPAVVSSTRLTCVLPTPPPSYYSVNTTGYLAGQVLLQVLYDGLQGSNSYRLVLYDSLLSPVFTSMQGPGCSAATVDAATGLWPTFSGCDVTAEFLTITGMAFSPTPATMNVQTGTGLYCNPVASDPPANTTYTVCRLGGAVNNPAALTAANPFYVLVSKSGGWVTSHLFYVRFVAVPGNGTRTEGGGGKELSAGVTAAIVVCSVVGLMAVAAVGWWGWRRRMQKGSSGQGGGVVDRQSGGGYVDSESYGEAGYVPPGRGVAEVPMASLSGR